MLGAHVRADFEHAEVALFVGKNPWQSHGIPRARTTLKEIAHDPARSMIVIDPRRTETAELADFHLQVRPGTDAWCLAALGAVLVQEDLLDHALAGRARRRARRGRRPPRRRSTSPSTARSPASTRTLVRAAARRIAGAGSVAVFEDLGVQMSLHSTLVELPREAAVAADRQLRHAGRAVRADHAWSTWPAAGPRGRARRGPARSSAPAIISGLVPCNVIAEEILTDHPARYRAMLVESANPAHSLADSQRMREALGGARRSWW